MKTAVIIDFDTRRVLFQKIVESLDLFPSMESWDLTWGEPFLAVTNDRSTWVRVFYEESLPGSAEKLKSEVERLLPHLTPGGELILCLPQSCETELQAMLSNSFPPVRVWSYSHAGNGSVFAHERGKEASKPPILEMGSAALLSSPAKLDQRLSADEVRELAEMGLELKRFISSRT